MIQQDELTGALLQNDGGVMRHVPAQAPFLKAGVLELDNVARQHPLFGAEFLTKIKNVNTVDTWNPGTRGDERLPGQRPAFAVTHLLVLVTFREREHLLV